MAKESQPTEQATQAAAPQKSGINKMLIIVGVPVFLVQLIFLYFVFTKLMGGSSASAEGKTEKAAEKSEAKEEKSSEGGEQKVFVIKDIIVNPAGTNGTRYLLTTVGIAVSSAELEKELTNKEVMVRDALNTILASKQLAELSDNSFKESLKKEIEQKVNTMLESGKVTSVYFSKFIIQ
ncbi:MAG: flagellar basal body-associated FliL family protein [Ignavibacteriales bacterium]|nr:flagellar basal body-associated FliL family protein [Ignavibacteriales bacterium]